MAKPLLIQIASDVICPWCYIGKRRRAGSYVKSSRPATSTP